MFLASRGWSATAWNTARDRLAVAAWSSGTGSRQPVAPSGRSSRRPPTDWPTGRSPNWATRGASDAYEQLAAVSTAVAGSGVIPFPNPMGLPPGPG